MTLSNILEVLMCRQVHRLVSQQDVTQDWPCSSCHVHAPASHCCQLPSLCVLLTSQSVVNKLVGVVLSVTKDVPLWTYSHLQYKQQQVRSSDSSCFKIT